ncbi:AraC family transcriptional regulator [Ketobacter alkanivorans]|uniref:HTH araC/xylS-type domain-containing protein n=1 Tax=Ketobacter alkanivorans TaxID=1917421 RepID=A0A2K9LLJ7_9GAMM|nr:AraC family transcriptional regulator [Ketobacter alkanivorans]AUM11674.1 hypothetical protein Kalk_04230 [Ketobacter alkanivorans]
MSPPSEVALWHQETVPIQYMHAVLLAAEDWDADFAHQPIPRQLKERYPAHCDRIPLLEFIQLCFCAAQQFPKRGISYDIGWQLPPTAYGNLGYAMLCSESLLDSVNIMERYWALISKSVSRFNWYEQDDLCVIDLTINDHLQGPLRALWIEASLTSWQRCIESMLGEPLTWKEIWLDHSNTCQHPPKQAAIGSVKFNMPSNQLRFPSSYLKVRLPMANSRSFAIAVDNCEKDMHFNGLDGGELIARVKALLTLSDSGYPSLEALSDQLNVSSRTLRRQLSSYGYGYKSMLDQVRRQDAIRLLCINDLTIQQVSDLLGYSDPASFSRAFRQWSGQSPQRFRHQGKIEACPI